ncbi:MAG: hypothetical protein AAFQ68_21695 [Bacteroidota bacterium]
MRHTLFSLLLAFSLPLLGQDQPHADNVYKVGAIGGIQLSPGPSYDARLGLVVERCAPFGFRSGFVLRTWNPALRMDVYRSVYDNLTGQDLVEYYGQEHFRRLYLLGVPLQLNYYLNNRLRVNAGLQADVIFTSRTDFISASGEQWQGKGSGHRAFVSPHFSVIGGIDVKLAPGIWLNTQYQAGLGPFVKENIPNAALDYQLISPAASRRHVSLNLIVYFWRFEEGGSSLE